MALADAGRGRPASEEAQAAARVVLALTLAVGLLGGAIGLIAGEPLALLAPPALVMLASLARGATLAAAWSGATVWAVLIPIGQLAGAAAALPMLVACLAIALGPERLGQLVARDFGALPPERSREEGWIEDL